jgi:hypothetical protein
MTGSDLMALVPWLIFGAGLAVVYLRLRKPHQRSGRPSLRPGRPLSRPGRRRSPRRHSHDGTPGSGPPSTDRDDHEARS